MSKLNPKPFKNYATYRLKGDLFRTWVKESYHTRLKQYLGDDYDRVICTGYQYCVDEFGNIVDTSTGQTLVPNVIRNYFSRQDNK